MNVAMEQAESITLDHWSLPSPDVQRQTQDLPPRSEWRVENKLRQSDDRAKTSTLFKCFNGHYLSIKTHRRRKELPERVIDLAFVEPQPREVKDYRYPLWFVAVCLMTAPAIVYSLIPASPVWLAAPVAMAVVLMTAALRLRQHRFDFLALNSNIVLFSLNARDSDQAKATGFRETVCAGIVTGQTQLPEGKQRVPLAVADMRRLSEQGVITSDQYQTLKKRWFAL